MGGLFGWGGGDGEGVWGLRRDVECGFELGGGCWGGWFGQSVAGVVRVMVGWESVRGSLVVEGWGGVCLLGYWGVWGLGLACVGGLGFLGLLVGFGGGVGWLGGPGMDGTGCRGRLLWRGCCGYSSGCVNAWEFGLWGLDYWNSLMLALKWWIGQGGLGCGFVLRGEDEGRRGAFRGVECSGLEVWLVDYDVGSLLLDHRLRLSYVFGV
ncbi:hypothetical protein Tco_1302329 [Tanacetum coccineum]